MRRGGDEGNRSQNGEVEALARLREHEHELDRRLDNAQKDAKELLAEAGREARRLKERAETELLAAVERLRQEQVRELTRALAAVQEETARRCEALRRQADLNRERVLVWLTSRVTGKDPT